MQYHEINEVAKDFKQVISENFGRFLSSTMTWMFFFFSAQCPLLLLSLNMKQVSFAFFFFSSYWMKPNVIFCRNKMRKTPVQMAERRGVSFEVLHHLRKLAELEDCDNVVVTNTSERNYYGQTIFMDFCNSVGLKVFTLVILVLLVCSLYVAYMITGFASTEKRILIDSTSSRIEL